MGNMLQIGIIGLGQSGKTTVFNALCSAHAQVGDFSSAKSPNLAVIKVPDKRLERLIEIFQPAKVTHAEIEFIDIAGMSSSPSHSGASHPRDDFRESAYITAVRQANALLVVVRCFEDVRVPHPNGSVDPARDIAAIEMELIFADLVIVDKRLEKVKHMLRVRPATELKAELTLLEKLKGQLEAERPLREMSFVKEELGAMGSFGFMSLKPVLYLLNLGENQIADAPTIEARYFQKCGKNMGTGSLCGKIEMELAALGEDERAEFLTDLGIDQLASAKVIRKSSELLGLISFLTGSEKEVRAWPVPHGRSAWEAAGEIHSDIQRGFIKAEVITFAELDKIGDWGEAKKHGKIRMEGKEYVIKDGDVILYRFNV